MKNLIGYSYQLLQKTSVQNFITILNEECENLTKPNIASFISKLNEGGQNLMKLNIEKRKPYKT